VRLARRAASATTTAAAAAATTAAAKDAGQNKAAAAGTAAAPSSGASAAGTACAYLAKVDPLKLRLNALRDLTADLLPRVSRVVGLDSDIDLSNEAISHRIAP
jgi:hypothetical protein